MTILEALEKCDKKLEFHFSFDLKTNYNELVLYILYTNPLKLRMDLMSISGYVEDAPIIESELKGYLYETEERSYQFYDKEKQVEYMIMRNYHKAGGSYQLYVTINTTKFEYTPSFEWISDLYSKFPFIIGYVYDQLFVDFQSSTQPIIMRVNHIDPGEYSHLVSINAIGHESLDVSRNYGRKCLVGSLWLMASWQMFITSRFEEKLGSKFISPQNVKVLYNNEFRVIQLYDNPFESHLKENLDKLKAIRDLNHFDEIEYRDNK